MDSALFSHELVTPVRSRAASIVTKTETETPTKDAKPRPRRARIGLARVQSDTVQKSTLKLQLKLNSLKFQKLGQGRHTTSASKANVPSVSHDMKLMDLAHSAISLVPVYQSKSSFKGRRLSNREITHGWW